MANKAKGSEQVENLKMELRRGALVLAVLSQLRQEHYGYSLKQYLAENGLDINEGTLYPLLRRLESQTLLVSEWRVIDEARPRRYYRLSDEGLAALEELGLEWEQLSQAIDEFLKDK